VSNGLLRQPGFLIGGRFAYAAEFAEGGRIFIHPAEFIT
jgi:hypothetical protein